MKCIDFSIEVLHIFHLIHSYGFAVLELYMKITFKNINGDMYIISHLQPFHVQEGVPTNQATWPWLNDDILKSHFSLLLTYKNIISVY